MAFAGVSARGTSGPREPTSRRRQSAFNPDLCARRTLSGAYGACDDSLERRARPRGLSLPLRVLLLLLSSLLALLLLLLLLLSPITIHYRRELQRRPMTMIMMTVVAEHFHRPAQRREETGVYPGANRFGVGVGGFSVLLASAASLRH